MKILKLKAPPSKLAPPKLKSGRHALSVVCLMLFASFVFAINMKTSFVSVTAFGVVPGKEYSLRAKGLMTLKIYNKGKEKIKVKFEALPLVEDGFDPLPDGDWISFERDALEIEPGSSAETDVLINVPDEKKYYGRKFATVIVSSGSAGGNISAGLRSKLFFTTIKRKSFFMRLFGK